MPELSDLLHRSVDDVDVPHPHVAGIAARGRALRTRRRVATVAAAAVVLGAIGGGVALVDPFAGKPRSNHSVTNEGKDDADELPTAYESWATWSATDHEVTVGGIPVTVPGQVVRLSQTTAGVVVKSIVGEAGRFTLVRPDGSTRRLSIPDGTPTVDGDIAAPRVAWVSSRAGELVLHVWDVVTDSEVGQVALPSPGSTLASGGEILEPALLDGDAAYFSTADHVAHRVEWRSGKVTDLPRLPMSVRSGVGVARDDDGQWVVVDAVTGEVRRSVEGGFSVVTVSPDGRWLFLGGTDGQYVEPTAGGDRVPLDRLSISAGWSQDGALIGQDGSSPWVRRCLTSGICATQRARRGDDSVDTVLAPDFLNAG